MTPPASQQAAESDGVTVTINATSYQVPRTFSEVTLNDYLRSHLFLHGTKVCCREGGCGTCVVTATYPDPTTGQIISRAINSCLTPILSCDGWEITTVEGIGNQKNPHPVQQRLTDHYGTQCGYCTPGMVMSMYSLLQCAPGNKPSKEDVETSLGGNLCRCTGYRPILEAFKTFSDDGDVEESTKTLCLNTGQVCDKACHRKPEIRPYVRALPASIGDLAPVWYKPQSLADVYKLLPELAGQNPYFVVGRTGVGVYNDGPYGAMVDMKGIKELSAVKITSSVFSMGANLPLTDVINLFKKQSGSNGFQHLMELAAFLSRTAHVPVRNAGSWAGNLAMKHRHREFPSETFLVLVIAEASIVIGPDEHSLPVLDFMDQSLDGKIILRAELPPFGTEYIFRTYKIMPRSQNSHALVNSGFRAKIDKQQAGKFVFAEKPILAFGNIAPSFTRADKTETFLTGKDIGDVNILQQALTILKSELQPEEIPAECSPAYRVSLSLSLLYKFVLEIVDDKADGRYRSAIGYLQRPVSSGVQSFPTKKENWPLTQPIPKIESMVQCTGEAKYVSDIEQEGMLHAALVLTTQARASIKRIDATQALALSGVVRVLTAKDIPGQNNMIPPFPNLVPEKLLADTESMYAGESVAIVVAETRDLAEAGAKLVKVEYSNVKKPIITCHDAIRENSYLDEPTILAVGADAEKAVASAPHKISGELEIGLQGHFFMETMAAVSTPTEDGLNIEATTQWLDYTQDGVAQCTGLPKNRVHVAVRRTGGGFGGKIFRQNTFIVASAVAAWILKRPVKIHSSLWDTSKNVGKRYPYYGKYQVGFDAQGKLLGIVCDVYCDAGCIPGFIPIDTWRDYGDSGYNCPARKFTLYKCKTDLPPHTSVRAPGSTEALFFMEYMMEHVAQTLKKPSIDVKRLNFYKDGDAIMTGDVLKDCRIASVTEQLLQSADYIARNLTIVQFNQANRWRKRGMTVTPMRFPVSYMFWAYNCYIAIYHNDGTVAITHGGVELGQGINTKVAQMVAYQLGIDMKHVVIQPNTTLTNANGSMTAASVGSELCCLAAMDCCKQIKERMKPIRAELGESATWAELVEACFYKNIDLSAHAWTAPQGFNTAPAVYHTYGAMCTEVELDTLTGEYQINRVDVLYDCGESMSPLVDVGQVEGAIVMGLGYYTSENVIYDKNTGENLTTGTWKYKPPTAKDIPIDFRVSLLQNAPNPSGILRSKMVGEPPLNMTASVVFALRNAIAAQLKDAGQPDNWFRIDAPMTVERAQQYGNIDISELRFKD